MKELGLLLRLPPQTAAQIALTPLQGVKETSAQTAATIALTPLQGVKESYAQTSADYCRE